MEHKVVTDYTNVNTANEYLKVFVRARPPENKDHEAEDMYVVGPGATGERLNKKIMLKDPRHMTGGHAFLFDRVFWTEEAQNSVFEEVTQRCIKHCFKGYNACCFAYGQTGSGKTYSMFGQGGEARGLIPRAVEKVFEIAEERSRTHEVAVLVSFLEMYCDNIRDLGQAYLDKTSRPGQAQKTSDLYLEAKKNRGKKKATYRSQNLEIREDAYGNVFVKDLSVIPVTTPEEVITIVQMGFRLRATHETKMNAVSSRSHTVFTMTVVQKDRGGGDTITGMLNLVDLAGSERLHKSESEGQRLREALSINSSLSALGKVVMALDPSAPGHVPYRDSKLTRLLQNSVGGNSYTALLACIHPRNSDYDECLSTLQFANRCRNVRNQPRVNYVDQSAEDKDRRIRKLQAEVDGLRTAVDGLHRGAGSRLQAVLAMLGIKGTLLPDGRFRTADGKIVGVGNNDALSSIAGALRGADMFGAGMGSPGGGARPLPDSRVKKMLDVERRNVQLLKQKLLAKKEEVSRLKAQAKKDNTELRSFLAGQRKNAEERKEVLMETQRRLQTRLVLQDENTQQLLQELVDHNQRLLENQYAILSSVPAALKVNSEVLHKARAAEGRVRKLEETKRLRDMRHVEHSAAVELQAVRQRLEQRIREQKSQIDEMTAEATRYHAKRRQQVTEYRAEIEALAKYVRHCNTVLANIERGTYPVRQLASGRKTFALPAACRARDPLKGMDLSRFTKTLHTTLATSDDTGEVAVALAAASAGAGSGAGHGAGAGADPGQPTSALEVIRAKRSQHAWSGADGAGESAPKHRSSTRGSARSSGGSLGTTGKHTPKRPVSPLLAASASHRSGGLPEARAMRTDDSVQRMALEGVDFDTPVDMMSVDDLRRRVEQFRQLLRSGIYEKIEEHVLNDLAEHPTAMYIRELEATVTKLQGTARDEAQKHRELRIAYMALQRAHDKMKLRLAHTSSTRHGAAGGGPASRPASSRSTGHRGTGMPVRPVSAAPRPSYGHGSGVHGNRSNGPAGTRSSSAHGYYSRPGTGTYVR